MKSIRPFAIALLFAALTGCGQAAVTAAGHADAGYQAAAASLNTRARNAFRDVFDGYDANHDGTWTPKDFDLPEDRFLNLFGKTDADDDHVVTWQEYHSDDEHEALVVHCEARAKVSKAGVGGRVNLDKTYYMMDAYLAPYLNKRERHKYVKQAFKKTDANDDEQLNQSELAYCYAIMEAKASELYIQKRVNRSKGQPKG